VDGFIKYEKWAQDDITDFKDSKSTSWLKMFIGRRKKPVMIWSFPFVEGRMFVLTIQAGV
jgi:hydroxyproline O-galactosyltransferase 2/3/4/5/6